MRRALCLAGLLAACAAATLPACSDDGEPAAETQAAGPLTALELLTRASLDVRGVRPTPDEVRKVLADPTQVDGVIDAFVDDPRFLTRIRDIFAPALRTRIDYYPLYASDFGLSDEATFHASIAEEPLMLLAWIAANDRPYTDLVEADVTVTNDLLASIWPLEDAPPDGVVPDGWRLARYTDGRPHVGVLSQNAVFWRHTSTVDNANRGRSEALSKALLCTSWLERPIDFPKNVDLTDHDAIVEAVHENEGCTACHATMDPFASHLWGFMQPDASAAEWPFYHPAKEHDWLLQTKREPGYFGTPTTGLQDLGPAIARDERFVHCAVKRVYEAMVGRRATLDDDGALLTHREAFLSSGLRLKALVRSLLHDPAYRGLSETTPFGGRPEAAVLKTAPVSMVASSLEALSGYRLTIYGRRAVDTDEALRSIAGGSDGALSTEPSTGLLLVHRRLAEVSAAAIVDEVSSGPVGDVLGDGKERPTPEVVANLLLLVLGREVAADGPEVASLLALWDTAEGASGKGRDATIALLTALFADPEMLLY